MTGILAALRQDNFTCYGPASVDDIDLSSVPDDRDTRPPRGKFLEIPRPSGRFLPVPAIADSDPLLFRFLSTALSESRTPAISWIPRIATFHCLLPKLA